MGRRCGGSHFGRFARSTSDIAQTGRPAAACGGMSGLPKQLKNRQNCCRNATPAEYMFPKVKNAQKGGTCLSFLLHGRDGAFQIGISSTNLAAVSVIACPWGRRNRA